MFIFLLENTVRPVLSRLHVLQVFHRLPSTCLRVSSLMSLIQGIGLQTVSKASGAANADKDGFSTSGIQTHRLFGERVSGESLHR